MDERLMFQAVIHRSQGVFNGEDETGGELLKSSPGIQAMYQLHKNVREDREKNTADEFIANPDEKCQANHIKLSVTSSGKSYTVSIPATGHWKTYQTRSK